MMALLITLGTLVVVFGLMTLFIHIDRKFTVWQEALRESGLSQPLVWQSGIKCPKTCKWRTWTFSDRGFNQTCAYYGTVARYYEDLTPCTACMSGLRFFWIRPGKRFLGSSFCLKYGKK